MILAGDPSYTAPFPRRPYLYISLAPRYLVRMHTCSDTASHDPKGARPYKHRLFDDREKGPQLASREADVRARLRRRRQWLFLGGRPYWSTLVTEFKTVMREAYVSINRGDRLVSLLTEETLRVSYASVHLNV